MENTRDSFFSLDRLVEFGLGMAMSQQIVQSMNNMMASMRQPPLAQNVYATLPVQQAVNPQTQQPMYQQYASHGVQAQQVSQSPAAFGQVGALAGKTQSQPVPPPLPQEAAVPPKLPEVFYAVIDGKQSGPHSCTELARLVRDRKVSASTLVWKPGLDKWRKAEDFSDLLYLISLMPPAIDKNDAEENTEKKNENSN